MSGFFAIGIEQSGGQISHAEKYFSFLFVISVINATFCEKQRMLWETEIYSSFCICFLTES